MMMQVAPRKRRDRISAVHEGQHGGGADGGDSGNDNNKKKKKNQKQSKKARVAAAEAAEEQRLTNLLFGGGGGGGAGEVDFEQDDSFVKGQDDLVQGDGYDEEEEEEQDEEVANVENSLLFEIDRKGDGDVAAEEEDDDGNGVTRKVKDPQRASSAAADDESHDEDEENRSTTSSSAAAGAAAWVDDDDAQLKVNLLDTSRLRKLRKSRTEEAASALSGVELEERLRHRYQSSDGGGGAGGAGAVRTDWADLNSDGQLQKNDDDDNDSSKSESDGETKGDFLFNSSASLLRQPGVPKNAGVDMTWFPQQRLPPHTIQMVRCPDANQVDPNSSVVQAVHFHPGSDPDRPLVLTAGLDKTLRFFQVGVEKSEKIHGIHFPKMPIYSASFLGASSGKVVASGRRPFFYLYDTVAGKLDQVPKIVGRARQEKSLERCVASPDGRTIAFCGNDGYIILYDAHNKRWITDLKVNGSVRAICFTPGGGEHHHVMASGSDGDVYRWDLRNSRRPCIERFSNQDGTITSCLAASSQHFAVGAESGVVNLYASHQAPGRGSSGSGMSAVLASAGRTPVKSILNLHTSADMVRFNGDGQILAMSTRRERQNNNSLKLLHVPTATVFSNWPTSKTPLGYVWSMDFSPQSKFLAIGNDKGKCLLYRLNHYHYMDN